MTLLAAGMASAGTVLFTPGCCSSGCCSSSCGDACAAPRSCGGVYGSWAITLPYPEMNAAHLILEKGKDGKTYIKIRVYGTTGWVRGDKVK